MSFWWNKRQPTLTHSEKEAGRKWSTKYFATYIFILIRGSSVEPACLFSSEREHWLARDPQSGLLMIQAERCFTLIKKKTKRCTAIFTLISTRLAQIWGLIRNRDSSPTRQFADTHFEDSSPTELKTVHRQNWRQFIDKFYIVFIWNVTIFTIYWCYNERMPNIKLIKLPICYCNMILLDMHTAAYYIVCAKTRPMSLTLNKYLKIKR